MKIQPLKYKSLQELENKFDDRKKLELIKYNDDGHELIEKFNAIKKENLDKSDQEELYLKYYKLIILKNKIFKTKISGDAKYINLMINENDCKEIETNFHNLRSDLKDRYDQYDQFKILKINDINVNDKLNLTTSIKNYIICKELFNLIQQLDKQNLKLLLIDLRNQYDFKRSSISISNNSLIILNIPQDHIAVGLTGSAIESFLGPNEAKLFKNRNNVNNVILMDYDSISLNSNEKLNIFYQALTKYDTTSNRLQKEPLFLKGGYSDWVLTYPTYCTDPSYTESNFNKTTELNYEEDDEQNKFNFNNNDVLERIYSRENSMNVPGSARFIKSTDNNDNLLRTSTINSNFRNNLSNNFAIDNDYYTVNNKFNTINKEPKEIIHKIHIDQDDDDRDSKFNFNQNQKNINLNNNFINNNTISSFLNTNNSVLSKPIAAFKTEINNNNENDFSNSYNDTPSIFSSSLNNRQRSKSYTNITDLPNDENDDQYNNENNNNYSNSTKPSFDRSNKPNTFFNELTNKPNTFFNELTNRPTASFSRDFSPIYGASYQPTGLKNLGNTCFMNAVIQCLFNVKIFSKYFINENYYNDLNSNSKFGTKGELAGFELTEEFGLLLKQMDNSQYKHISPKDFKRCVGRHITAYSGYEQQDSHEFLLILFEKLNADLNKAQFNKTNIEIPDKLPDKEAIERFWRNHLNNNESIISKLFEGLIMSTLECDACKKKSNTFDVFTCLSLPIPNNVSRCELSDCLKEFTKNEIMCDEAAWQCPECKIKRSATKKTSIVKLPKVLIIHLKRFSYEGRWKQKISISVDFPTVNLNLRHFTSIHVNEQVNPSYDLIGVVDHTGTLEGGHYTAICRSERNNNIKWNKYDDQDVYEVPQSDVVSHKAYLLFYVLNE